MTSLNQLKERLKNSQRFLVISGDQVELADDHFLRPRFRGGFSILLLVDLRQSLHDFAELVGPDSDHFSLMQIAQVTGMPYQKAWKWLSNGLLTASIDPAGGHGKERVFSCSDAFSAFVLVNLRKHGLAMTTLVRVAKLLRELAQPVANYQWDPQTASL
jgi:hypothetical protein